MYYINTLKLGKNLALLKPMSIIVKWFVVDRNRCNMAAKFGVFVDELPTLVWLPKL